MDSETIHILKSDSRVDGDKRYAQTRNSDAMVIPMFTVEGQLSF